MTPSFRPRILAAVATALLLSASACSTDSPAPAAGPLANKPVPVARLVTRPVVANDASVHLPGPFTRPSDQTVAKIDKDFRFDEWEQVALVFDLKDPQLAAWRQKMAQWRQDAQAAEDGPENAAHRDLKARADAAKKAGDNAAAQALKPQIEQAGKWYGTRRAQLRVAMLANLSAPMQTTWIQWVLYRGIIGGSTVKSAQLTDAQRDQLWDACAKPAARTQQAGVLVVDPYLGSLGPERNEVLEQMKASILTAEQRAKLAAPATKNAR